jgi:hypothetical protein
VNTAPPQPKLVSHCASLYAKMDAEAKESDSSGARIWRGKIVDACISIGIAIGSYSRVVNALRTLGCIEQLEQGNRGRATSYRLVYPPTPEVWKRNAPERTEDLTNAPSLDILSAQIEDVKQELKARLGGIDVVAALATLEQQVSNLQEEFKSFKQQTAKQEQ